MRVSFMHPWLWLTAAATATAGIIGARSGSYTPIPLENMIKKLGLEEVIKDTPGGDTSKDPRLNCIDACRVLLRALPDETQLPDTTPYVENQKSYWAQQQSMLRPACFVAVDDTSSVEKVLAVARQLKCPFAVRSGGNSHVPGASSDNGGIVIDLSKISWIEIAGDRKTVLIGPGKRWVDVFRDLDREQLTVIGGRVDRVGVGGLTLGGGLSFLSGLGGFACDNVLQYQVMMADGQILNVNQESHPQLYFALRGGGNNFGVVLSLQFGLRSQGEIWAGSRYYAIQASKDITKGVAYYNENAAKDPNFSIIGGFIRRGGADLSTLIMVYSKPTPNPQILQESFKELSEQFPKPFKDTTRVTNITQLALEFGQGMPAGFREQFTTATYKNSQEIQDLVLEIFLEEVKTLEAKISDADFVPILSFHPLSKTTTSFFSARGGNALGVGPNDGALLVLNLYFRWSRIEDDPAVHATINQILTRSNEKAKEKGLLHRYIYMNYAAADQKPITSYGEENVKKLREAQQKYDPERIFELLQPGGFKLNQ